ncbi:MAG TPA: HupE/UreJ family protein [Polyangiaceae bacterium]|nr:HupE/UreJ family protein [Polyangiaceae bacterium]
MRPRSTALALAVLTCVLLLLAARTAAAHAVGLSKGDYTAAGTDVVAELTFARGDLVALVSGLDANGDGVVDARELARAKPAIEAVVLGGIAVEGDGASCRATLESAELAEPDGVDVRGRYRCASPPSQVHVRVQLLEDLAEGHRHVARLILGSSTADDVLRRGHDDIAAGATKPPASVGSFFRLGVEHILTGYDHLVFLFGLVLVGGRLRSLVGAVTAFTVAHSITLALAVLGVWAPSPRIVEPAIALSIVWVGIENFFVRDAHGRWRITFPFGLVHGFGFAGALREIELPHARVPAALVTFNLGVEVGQLAVMALVVPAIVLLRKGGLLGRTATLVLSAGVAAAGAYWFITRVVP